MTSSNVYATGQHHSPLETGVLLLDTHFETGPKTVLVIVVTPRDPLISELWQKVMV